ncbi:hypothetical protein ACQKWADRAFT_311441 [Trichoderma austrokoningii]
MASITRSNRRAEGLHLYDRNVNASGPLTRSAPGPNSSSFHHGRTKRSLDVAEREFEALRHKKTRIAVEILAKPQLPVESVNVHPPPIPRRAAVASSASRSPAPVQPTTKPLAAAPTAAEPQSSGSGSGSGSNLTKHQAKVINGIKHELDRLQPRRDDTKEQGRKLRSQEATRFKSELSAYFPDYDEVIGNDPKEEHLLNPETPIVIIDTSLSRAIPDPPRNAPRPHHRAPGSIDFPGRGYGDALFTDVFDSQRIDFGFLEAQHKNKDIDDPLPDGLFEPIHKKAERVERSIRNTEKGRAQHEKDQIIRLLEGLQGHDWLRVMGVSGVTETKKKKFEPARMHFIKGCQAILAKFRNWNLEEKRRKLEKEKALAEKAEEDGETDESEDESRDGHSRQSEDEDEDEVEGDGEDEDEEDVEEDEPSQDDTSETSSPAKQLRREARARSKLAAANSTKPRIANRLMPPIKPPEPPKEFKSFFSKRYERDSALNRQRRVGRKVLAWGLPLPEIAEADFELPEEYRDEETLKTRARKKRRDRRELRTSK